MFIIVGSTSSTGLTGLYVLERDNSLTFLKVIGGEHLTNATWMVPFPSGAQTMLLSTDESKGIVHTFEVIVEKPDVSLHLRSSIFSGGQGTTHLALATSTTVGEPERNLVIVSNYDSGSVSVLELPLKATSPVQIIDHNLCSGGCPAAHAHQCVIRNGVAHVCDLGHDTIYSYAILAPRVIHPLILQGEYKLPTGSGPRHLVIDRAGEWAYVLNELSSTVAAVRIDPTTYLLTNNSSTRDGDGIQSSENIFSTLPAGVSATDMAGAAIVLSEDGNYLYVSNRDVATATASSLASDRSSVSVFAIKDNGSSLQLIQTVSSRGRHPRHMILVTNDTGSNSAKKMSGETEVGGVSTGSMSAQQVLLVANRDSQNFAVFPVNTATGRLVEEEVVVSACDPLCKDPGFIMPC